MKIAFAVLFVASLGAVPSAFAANWKLVNDGELFAEYIDMTSIKNKENTKTVWALRNYKSVQTTSNGEKYRSAKIWTEYNCKDDMHKRNYFALYGDEMGGGVSLLNNSNPESWSPIVPESVAESKIQIVCSR